MSAHLVAEYRAKCDRIRRLRVLIERAKEELASLENSIARTAAATNRLGGARGGPDVEPSKAPAATIRAWARANGIPVTERGMVPRALREDYARAMQGVTR